MSRLVKGIKNRVGGSSVGNKFQFDFTIHSAANIPQIKCSAVQIKLKRGKSAAITRAAAVQGGLMSESASWEERLSVESTLLKNTKTNAYDHKEAKLSIQALQGQSRKPKSLGSVFFDLRDFVGVGTVPYRETVSFILVKSRFKKAKMYTKTDPSAQLRAGISLKVTIESRFLQVAVVADDDEEMSDASMASCSSASRYSTSSSRSGSSTEYSSGEEAEADPLNPDAVRRLLGISAATAKPSNPSASSNPLRSQPHTPTSQALASSSPQAFVANQGASSVSPQTSANQSRRFISLAKPAPPVASAALRPSELGPPSATAMGGVTSLSAPQGGPNREASRAYSVPNRQSEPALPTGSGSAFRSTTSTTPPAGSGTGPAGAGPSRTAPLSGKLDGKPDDAAGVMLSSASSMTSLGPGQPQSSTPNHPPRQQISVTVAGMQQASPYTNYSAGQSQVSPSNPGPSPSSLSSRGSTSAVAQPSPSGSQTGIQTGSQPSSPYSQYPTPALGGRPEPPKIVILNRTNSTGPGSAGSPSANMTAASASAASSPGEVRGVSVQGSSSSPAMKDISYAAAAITVGSKKDRSKSLASEGTGVDVSDSDKEGGKTWGKSSWGNQIKMWESKLTKKADKDKESKAEREGELARAGYMTQPPKKDERSSSVTAVASAVPDVSFQPQQQAQAQAEVASKPHSQVLAQPPAQQPARAPAQPDDKVMASWGSVVGQMRGQMQEIQRTSSQSQGTNASIPKAHLEEMRETLQWLQKDRELLIVRMQELQAKYGSELQRQIDTAKLEVRNQCMAEMSSLVALNKELQRKLETGGKGDATKSKEMNDLQSELVRLMKERDLTISSLTAEWEQRMDQARQDHVAEIQHIQNSADDEIARLQGELAAARAMTQGGVKAGEKSWRDRCLSLEGECERLRVDLSRTKAELSTVKAKNVRAMFSAKGPPEDSPPKDLDDDPYVRDLRVQLVDAKVAIATLETDKEEIRNKNVQMLKYIEVLEGALRGDTPNIWTSPALASTVSPRGSKAQAPPSHHHHPKNTARSPSDSCLPIKAMTSRSRRSPSSHDSRSPSPSQRSYDYTHDNRSGRSGRDDRSGREDRSEQPSRYDSESDSELESDGDSMAEPPPKSSSQRRVDFYAPYPDSRTGSGQRGQRFL